MNITLNTVFVPCEEGGFTAYIPELRGVVSEGETIAEAYENVLDALQLMLETERELQASIPTNALQVQMPIVISPLPQQFAEAMTNAA
jgi:predicted RNase H-like HicB family nuclease